MSGKVTMAAENGWLDLDTMRLFKSSWRLGAVAVAQGYIKCK